MSKQLSNTKKTETKSMPQGMEGQASNKGNPSTPNKKQDGKKEKEKSNSAPNPKSTSNTSKTSKGNVGGKGQNIPNPKTKVNPIPALPTPQYEDVKISVTKVMRLDFQFYAEKCKLTLAEKRKAESEFITLNEFQYKLFLRLFIEMLKEEGVEPFIIKGLLRYILEKGLVAWLSVASDTWTNYVISGNYPVGDTIIFPLISDFLTRDIPKEIIAKKLAQILRFGNRFSPAGLDFMKKSSLDEFIANEARNKLWDREHPVPMVIQCWAGDAFRNIYPSRRDIPFKENLTAHCCIGSKTLDSIEATSKFTSTPGAVVDACTKKGCKRLSWELEQDIPERTDDYTKLVSETPLFKAPYLTTAGLDSERIKHAFDKYAEKDRAIKEWYLKRFDQSCGVFGKNIVTPIPVPKSWKGGRIVCPDHVTPQSKQIAKITFLRNWGATFGFQRTLPFDDQSIQRENARLGSLTRDIVTFDLSSASDFNRKSLVRTIVWNDMANWLLKDVPDMIYIPGDGADKDSSIPPYYIELCYMFAPMGSAETFDVEANIFYSIIEGACNYQDFICSRDPDFVEEDKDTDHCIKVVGDDITVKAKYADIVKEWLEACGLKVNMSKSCLGDGPLGTFREACGGDYLNGYDISVKYWPRKILLQPSGAATYKQEIDSYTGLAKDSLSSLIALSKNLRPIYPGASRIINEIILAFYPDMTSSAPGTPCGDIWWEFDFHKPEYRVLQKAIAVNCVQLSRSHWFDIRNSKWRPYATVNLENRSLKEQLEDIAPMLEGWNIYTKFGLEFCPYVTFMTNDKAWVGIVVREGMGKKEYPILFKAKWHQETISLSTAKSWLKSAKKYEPHTLLSKASFKDLVEKASKGEVDPRDRMHYLPTVTWMEGKLQPKKCLACSMISQGMVDKEAASSWLTYQEFLEQGPRYETELDRLLNVSSPYRKTEQFGIPYVSWSRK